MPLLSTINIIGSSMTAQQLWLDIETKNVTNSNTTRMENGEGPYRRKMVAFEVLTSKNDFRDAMARGFQGLAPNVSYKTSGGAHVAKIAEDSTDFKLVYNPITQTPTGKAVSSCPMWTWSRRSPMP